MGLYSIWQQKVLTYFHNGCKKEKIFFKSLQWKRLSAVRNSVLGRTRGLVAMETSVSPKEKDESFHVQLQHSIKYVW
jgi:hypothetical protein